MRKGILFSGICRNIELSRSKCFYAFACNRWIKNNPLPNGKSLWDRYAQLKQHNQFVIKMLLERPIDAIESIAEKKSKMYYESCLDKNGLIERSQC